MQHICIYPVNYFTFSVVTKLTHFPFTIGLLTCPLLGNLFADEKLHGLALK